MKNSKFLSLLTAAALVVSSFSGLAMNGGVARAAGYAWGTNTPNVAGYKLNSVEYWIGGNTAAADNTSVYSSTLNLDAVMTGVTVSVKISATLTDADADPWDDNLANDDKWVQDIASAATTGLVNGTAVTAPNTATLANLPAMTVPTGYAIDGGANKIWSKANGTNKMDVIYFADLTIVPANITAEGTDYLVWGGANTNKIQSTINYTLGTSKLTDTGKGVAPIASDNRITVTIGSGTINETLTLTYYFNGATTAAAKNMADANVNKALGSPVSIASTGSGYAADSVAKTYSANSKLGAAFGATGYSVTYSVPVAINTNTSGLRAGDTVTISFPYGLGTTVGVNQATDTSALTYTVVFTGAGAGSLSFDTNNDIALTDSELRDGNGVILALDGRVANDTIKIRKVSGSSLIAFNTANVIDTKQAVVARVAANPANARDRIFVTAESDDERIIRATGYVGAANTQDAVLITPVGIGSANVRAKLWVVEADLTERCIGVTPWYNVEIIPAIDEVRIYNGKVQIDTFVDLESDTDSVTLTAEARNEFFGYVGDVKWAWESGNDYVNVVVNDDNSVTVTGTGNGSLNLYAVSQYNLAWTASGAYGATTKAKIDAGKEASRTTNYLYAIGFGVRYPFNNAYTSTIVSAANLTPGILLEKGGDVDVTRDGTNFQIKVVEGNKAVDVVARTNTTWLQPAAAASRTGIKFSVKSADEAIAKVSAITNNNKFSVTPVKAGTVTVTVTGEYLDGTKTVTLTRDLNVVVTGEGSVEPEPEHKAGEPVAEDGVTGYLNEDLETVTVTDATVVSKAITIPATIQGFKVVAIDPQAFKGTSAKTVYVVGSVDTIGKGAFKNSKVKKVYFTDPAALQEVGKNAFKKTNAKVVGLDGSFSEAAAKALKSAGAKTVKNNGTAK